MNCKEIRGLVLTDYIDGELAAKDKEEVDRHLAECGNCREFYAYVQASVSQPFLNTDLIFSSDLIWERVKEQIEHERQRKTLGLVDRWEDLKARFFIPKPALGIATLLLLFLVAGAGIGIHAGKENRQQRIDYLASLTVPMGDAAAATNPDLGTAIEKYFL